MKVWILSAYGDNGGAHMNYQIGVICQRIFDCEVIEVKLSDHELVMNNMNQPKLFDRVTIDFFKNQVESIDLLIANPSHSNYMFGLEIKCKKLMYVQGFSTFSDLDVNYDIYVSVSSHVQIFLESVYGIESDVISAFSRMLEPVVPFRSKKDNLIVYQKHDNLPFKIGENLVQKYCSRMGVTYRIVRSGISAKTLHSELNENKYLVSLSVSEGFGLVPLEAMSYGSIVIGLDGYGGRDYMKNGVNSFTIPFSQMHDFENLLETAFSSDVEYISKNAMKTSLCFRQNQFEEKWSRLLREAFRDA